MLVEEVGLGTLFVLAFANGANDVGKSVAPLVGDGGPLRSHSARRAFLWGGNPQWSGKPLSNPALRQIVPNIHSANGGDHSDSDFCPCSTRGSYWLGSDRNVSPASGINNSCGHRSNRSPNSLPIRSRKRTVEYARLEGPTTTGCWPRHRTSSHLRPRSSRLTSTSLEGLSESFLDN